LLNESVIVGGLLVEAHVAVTIRMVAPVVSIAGEVIGVVGGFPCWPDWAVAATRAGVTAVITYVAVATVESVYAPVPCENALMTSVPLPTVVIAPVYNVDRTVGALPFVV
jgi:hypothetical protein